MTERLTELLRAEAGRIEPPDPPADAIIATGRRRRHRRTMAAVVASALAVTMIGGGSWLVARTVDGSAPPASRPISESARDFATYGAFAVDSTLYIGERRVEFDRQILQIDYVRSGAIVSTESEDAPPDYFFVTGDGDVTHVAGGPTDPSVSGVGAEPGQDRMVWTIRAGGSAKSATVTLVVADARTGVVEQRIDVVDVPAQRSSYLAVPFLSGDTAYVRGHDATYEIDLDSAAVQRRDVAMQAVAGDVYLTRAGREVSVRSLEDDHLVLSATPQKRTADVSLSPNGRYLLVGDWGVDSYGGTVISARSGHREPFDSMGNGVAVCGAGCGWTASARVLGVSIHEPEQSTTCDPTNLRDCRVVPLDDTPNDADKRLGGIDYR